MFVDDIRELCNVQVSLGEESGSVDKLATLMSITISVYRGEHQCF